MIYCKSTDKVFGVITKITLLSIVIVCSLGCVQDRNGDTVMAEKNNMRIGMTVIMIPNKLVDRQKAKEFYVKTLGLNELIENPFTGEKLDANSPLILCNGKDSIILLYGVDKLSKADYLNKPGTTLVFYVDDIDKTYKNWKAKGVEFIKILWSEEESGIANCPFGRFIAFRDPFGNVHEILQPLN